MMKNNQFYESMLVINSILFIILTIVKKITDIYIFHNDTHRKEYINQ